MRTHEDGRVRHAGDVLVEFGNRMKAHGAFGTALALTYRNTEAAEAGEAMFAIYEDWQEVYAAVTEWLDQRKEG